MGDNNSKQSASVEGQAPGTFREILNVISKKTSELQEIIKNIKGGRLDEHTARQYLVNVFETTEAEINTLKVLSCQPRVTVMSCLVYKVIRDLESIYHLCINPIRRIGLIHK